MNWFSQNSKCTDLQHHSCLLKSPAYRNMFITSTFKAADVCNHDECTHLAAWKSLNNESRKKTAVMFRFKHCRMMSDRLINQCISENTAGRIRSVVGVSLGLQQIRLFRLVQLFGVFEGNSWRGRSSSSSSSSETPEIVCVCLISPALEYSDAALS